MKIIIYPHCKFYEDNGGLVVQYQLARCLKERGVNVKMFASHGKSENDIFDEYIDSFQDTEDTVVLYCEGIYGNPLGAKKVVRWMLSELGQNVPYLFVNSWARNELVYFYGSEVRFKNTPSYVGTVYKTLNVISTSPNIINWHGPRKGQCFTCRKMYIHKDVVFTHDPDAVKLGHCSMWETIQLFNEKEIFISYDPITYLSTIAALCGCVSVVIPLKGYSKNSWLQKTHMWDYVQATGEPIYGIAYGWEELEFAKSTLPLVRDQQIKINNFIKSRSLDMLLEDLQRFESCDNTIENVYFGGLTVLPILTSECVDATWDENTKLLESTGKDEKLLLKHSSGEIYEVWRNNKIMLNTFYTDLSRPCFQSRELDSNILFSILSLKEQQWKHGLVGQYEYFMKYYLHPHTHFLTLKDNLLVAYGMIKHCGGNRKIIDSVIVDKRHRSKGYGSELVQRMMGQYPGGEFILICEACNEPFYRKLGFFPQPITFTDKSLTGHQMVLATFPCTEVFSYNQEKLIHDGVVGGITMVHPSHLVFLTDYITRHRCSKMVEVGVAKGGVLALCALANPDMTIYGFDSWEGMPALTAEDDSKHEQYEGVAWSTLEDVYRVFDIMNAPLKNVHLVKGFVQDTLDSHLPQLENLDVLRLDVAWYWATHYCIWKLYEKVIPGGLVIIHDYYFNTGCQKAVDDFRSHQAITSPLHYYSYGDGVYWFK